MRRFRIVAGKVHAFARIDETETADAVWNALPIETVGNIWDDEIYSAIPVALGGDDARATVEKGDLGYWPPGKAFCIFFGPTPASSGPEIRPASPVNVFGRLEGEPLDSKAVRSGEAVRIERISWAPCSDYTIARGRCQFAAS
jgi:hypothetical protein